MKARLNEITQKQMVEDEISIEFLECFGIEKMDDVFEVVKHVDIIFGNVLTHHNKKHGLWYNLLYSMVDIIED